MFFTNASDTFWSGILTQVQMEDLKILNEQQRHEPMDLLSGRLEQTQMGWPKTEKEAYAVMA